MQEKGRAKRPGLSHVSNPQPSFPYSAASGMAGLPNTTTSKAPLAVKGRAAEVGEAGDGEPADLDNQVAGGEPDQAAFDGRQGGGAAGADMVDHRATRPAA